MLTIEGTYKNGHIVLNSQPSGVEESKVLITFIQPNVVDLQSRGIDKGHAAELRARFGSIVDDWEAPEMDIYDVD